MKVTGIVISLLLVGLSFIAMVNFMILTADNNNPSVSIGNESRIVDLTSDLTSDINTAETSINDTQGAFETSPITIGSSSGGGVLDAIGGIWRTMVITPKNIFKNIIGFVYENGLGDPTFLIVISVLTLIFLIVIIGAIIKMVSGVDP